MRLDVDLLAWADGYAEHRGVSRTVVFGEALELLRLGASAPAGRVRRPSGSPSAGRRVVEPSPAGVVDDVVPAAVPASVLSRAERFRRATQGGS